MQHAGTKETTTSLHHLTKLCVFLDIPNSFTFFSWLSSSEGLQGISHSRPVSIQNLISELYESIWTFAKTPWTGNQPDPRSVPTQDNITEKRGHTSMTQTGFEPAIPVFER